jgi:hypothetical protein
VLERRGVFRGYDWVRELARVLAEELPNSPYTYTNRLVEGRMAFLEWTAAAEHARLRDGADSFLVEDGWIVAQTSRESAGTLGANAVRRCRGAGPSDARVAV